MRDDGNMPDKRLVDHPSSWVLEERGGHLADKRPRMDFCRSGRRRRIGDEEGDGFPFRREQVLPCYILTRQRSYPV